MKLLTRHYAFLCGLMYLLTSCSPTGSHRETAWGDPDSTLQPRYARYFTVDYYPEGCLLRVQDPWHTGKELGCYLLAPTQTEQLPEGCLWIPVPVTRMAVNACSYLGMVEALGEETSLAGVCDAKRIYSPCQQRRLQNGVCTDLGDPTQINEERVLLLHPEAFLVTAFNQSDAVLERLSRAGVPVIYAVEWAEPDILGRAEWIKFVAAFFGKEAWADSLFHVVETRYHHLQQQATGESKQPSILPGLSFKGTWYMPGGRSYMAQLFRDAGGSYLYANNSSSHSLPLSLEVALKDFRDCDLWIGVEAASLHELQQMDERLCSFKAYQTGQVYNTWKRRSPTGGNDYWESAVAHPDWILEDLIRLTHPQLLPADSLRFLKKLD